jgi:hypothetical protein
MEVEAPNGSPIFNKRLSHMDLPGTDEAYKQENDMLAMLYRRHVEFAVGHGVAVHSDVDPDNPNRAVRITSRAIPSYEVPKTTPPTVADADQNPAFAKLAGLVLDMKELTETNQFGFRKKLEPLVVAYGEWIKLEKAKISDPDEGLRRPLLRRAEDKETNEERRYVQEKKIDGEHEHQKATGHRIDQAKTNPHARCPSDQPDSHRRRICTANAERVAVRVIVYGHSLFTIPRRLALGVMRSFGSAQKRRSSPIQTRFSLRFSGSANSCTPKCSLAEVSRETSMPPQCNSHSSISSGGNPARRCLHPPIWCRHNP